MTLPVLNSDPEFRVTPAGHVVLTVTEVGATASILMSSGFCSRRKQLRCYDPERRRRTINGGFESRWKRDPSGRKQPGLLCLRHPKITIDGASAIRAPQIAQNSVGRRIIEIRGYANAEMDLRLLPFTKGDRALISDLDQGLIFKGD